MITQERLKELLKYKASTGEFRWKVFRGRLAFAGDVAGGKTSKGYTAIKIDSVVYMAHRLAWLYVYGAMPTKGIDHKNGIKSDNRITNLRSAGRSENAQNKRVAHKHNISGYLGVSKSRNSWIARIRIDGRTIYLGSFDSPELAHKQYLTSKRAIHPFCTI